MNIDTQMYTNTQMYMSVKKYLLIKLEQQVDLVGLSKTAQWRDIYKQLKLAQTSVNQRKPADNKVRSKVCFSFSLGCVKPRIESSAVEML